MRGTDPNDSDSCSSFSSGDEDDDVTELVQYPHIVHVEQVDEEEDEMATLGLVAAAPASAPAALVTGDSADALASPHVHECCRATVASILPPSPATSDYNAFLTALHHLRCHWPRDDSATGAHVAAFRALRTNVFARFQRAFPLTPELYDEWRSDLPDAFAAQRALAERALADYPTVPTTLAFLRLLRDAEGEHVTREHVQQALKRALRQCGAHYTQGHEVWALAREWTAEWADEDADNDDNSATKGSLNPAFAKENAIRELFAAQMELPLQQNDLAMSEFRAWNNYNTVEKADERDRVLEAAEAMQQQVLAPFAAKFKRFEERVALAASATEPGAESIEVVWTQYLNFVRFRVLPKLEERLDAAHGTALVSAHDAMIAWFERAVSMVCLSAQLWIKYWQYLLQCDDTSPRDRLQFCSRAVRNASSDSALWNELLLELEHCGQDLRDIQAFVQESFLDRATAQSIDALHALNVLLTYCDIHRRHASQHTPVDSSALRDLETAFRLSEEFLEAQFSSVPAVATRLLEYQAKTLFNLTQNADAWKDTWHKITLKRPKEAEVWVTFGLECLSAKVFTIDEIRKNVYERAITQVQDQLIAVAEAWLRFEREHGDLANFLQVRQRLAKLSATAMPNVAAEDENKSKATDAWNTQPKASKRKRQTERPSKREQTPGAEAPVLKKPKVEKVQPEKRKQHENLTNDHTLFVCNVSKDATKEELHALFAAISPVKDVRLVVKARANHVKSRGMAYVEYDNEKAVEAGLKLNGTMFYGQELNVQRSNPPPHSASDGIPAVSKQEPPTRDGTWKTNPVTLYVGSIETAGNEEHAVDEDSLASKLTSLGYIVSKTCILKDKRGKPKNYGLVEFATPEDTKRCLDSLSQVREVLGSQATLKRSRFAIAEILEQQKTQQEKNGASKNLTKRNSQGKSRKHEKPAVSHNKEVPHSKPAARLALGTKTTTMSFVPSVLSKPKPVVASGDATRKAASVAAAPSAPTPSTGSKTNADFRRLFLSGKTE